MNLKTLHKWHQTNRGLLVFGVVELLAAYGLASLAIDTGSWWLYLLTFIFFVGATQNLFKLVRNLINGKLKS